VRWEEKKTYGMVKAEWKPIGEKERISRDHLACGKALTSEVGDIQSLGDMDTSHSGRRLWEEKERMAYQLVSWRGRYKWKGSINLDQNVSIQTSIVWVSEQVVEPISEMTCVPKEIGRASVAEASLKAKGRDIPSDSWKKPGENIRCVPHKAISSSGDPPASLNPMS
jgi:hypothetical protein